MRLLLALAMATAALLAGCSGGETADADADSVDAGSTLPGSGASPSAAAMQAAWTPETVPVSFDGTLGTSLRGCVFPASACESFEATPRSAEVVVERPGANFTGLDLMMTWTAQTPATQTLDLGFMVMASCEGCNDTSWEVASGTSPLRATLSGVDVPLPSADYVVHLYVYNPQGHVYDPAVPAYGGASVDQAFHVEGTVSFLVPPGAAGAAATSAA